MAKQQCQTCNQWFEDEELDEHINSHDEPVEETPPQVVKCTYCDIEMDAYFEVPFKIGKSDPAARLLVGWWSETDDPFLIDMYLCPRCRRIQLFASEKSVKKLKRSVHHEP